MRSGRLKSRRRTTRRLLAGSVIAAGVMAATSVPANAATTATFSSGVLTVTGDSAANAITLSRDAAGRILVNNGAITVVGGTPTVANTSLLRVLALGGNDVVTISEASGALPAANLFGGAGNDILTGGSGGDELFGQAGNDTLLGKGGFDLLFGGSENDTITGGDADDQAFGQGGDDRMIWNPGDDTDLNEGGDGTDTVEVNGGNGTEQFTATANGARVRFDRVTPAPFSIDIGTSENLVLNANGGDDQFSATGNLAALIKITADGGAGNDTLLGSNGADVLLGGDGNDFVDGNQGNDVGFLGAGADTFQWDPGDGSDTVEGQDGTDEMTFNGANIAERMDVTANGNRVRFTRDVANIVMDLNDVESIVAKTLGDTDNVTVSDLSGTDVTNVAADLAATGGGDDGAADNVIVNATSDDDAVTVRSDGPNVQVAGLTPLVSVSGAIAGSDRVTVNGLAGDDVLDASALAANSALLTEDGGDGDDVLLGGAGNDTLLGGAGDDVILGGPGNDTIDGGPGSNVVIQSLVTGQAFLDSHARVAGGETVLSVDGKQRTLPDADLAR
jgi:Ca2+-binding RTX toxin-like protein